MRWRKLRGGRSQQVSSTANNLARTTTANTSITLVMLPKMSCINPLCCCKKCPTLIPSSLPPKSVGAVPKGLGKVFPSCRCRAPYAPRGRLSSGKKLTAGGRRERNNTMLPNVKFLTVRGAHTILIISCKCSLWFDPTQENRR